MEATKFLTPRRVERFKTRRYFSTGDVVALTEASTRTVCGWLDEGHLSGAHLAGTQIRRVSRENLKAFLKERGYHEALKLLGDGPAPMAVPDAVGRQSRMARLPGKTYFSAGDIAILTSSSNHTVADWIDGGLLPGTRIGNKRERRVGRGALLEFLTRQGFHEAVAFLQSSGRRVLTLGLNGFAATLAAALPEGVALDVAESLWDAATLHTRHRPEAVVLGASVGYGASREVIAAVRADEPVPRVVAVRPESERPGWLGVDVVEVEREDAVLAALKL